MILRDFIKANRRKLKSKPNNRALVSVYFWRISAQDRKPVHLVKKSNSPTLVYLILVSFNNLEGRKDKKVLHKNIALARAS